MPSELQVQVRETAVPVARQLALRSVSAVPMLRDSLTSHLIYTTNAKGPWLFCVLLCGLLTVASCLLLLLLVCYTFGCMTPASTMYGTSAASQGARPKHRACAKPKWGLQGDKQHHSSNITRQQSASASAQPVRQRIKAAPRKPV